MVSGRVLAAGSGRPLARATVSLKGAQRSNRLTTLTDGEGGYSFRNVPADTYIATASKDGYVPAVFGGGSLADMGRLRVRDGERVRALDLRLRRGGVIAGQVLDEDGEPVLWATVKAFRRRYSGGGVRLEFAGSDETDDLGSFRVFGLLPGSYYVAVAPRPEAFGLGGTTSEPGRREARAGIVPTYYPSAPSPSEALLIRVEAESEASGLTVSLGRSLGSLVDGRLLPGNSSVSGGTVSLIEPDFERAGRLIAETTARGVDANFIFHDVPPGQYLVIASGQVEGATGVQYGSASLNVASDHVTVDVALKGGAVVRGDVTFEPRSDRVRGLQAVLAAVSPQPRSVRPLVGVIEEGGTFEIGGVPPGFYVVRLGGSPDWALLDAILDARDVSEEPFSVGPGDRVSGLRLRLTTRQTELSGTVTDGNSPISQVPVLLFSTNPDTWKPHSRAMEVTRSAASGRFRVRGLPAGEYFAAAVVNLDPGEWYDPDVLRALAARARRVRLVAGEPTVIDLRPTVFP